MIGRSEAGEPLLPWRKKPSLRRAT